jgi:hypothetical protein
MIESIPVNLKCLVMNMWKTSEKVRYSLHESLLSKVDCHRSIHKAMKIFKPHPSCVLSMHKMKEPDKGKRLQYSQWF